MRLRKERRHRQLTTSSREGAYLQVFFSAVLKDNPISILQSGSESDEAGEGRRAALLTTEWATSMLSTLFGDTQPAEEQNLDRLQPPSGWDPPHKLLLSHHSCFRFLLRFSPPFIFQAKGKLRGPICFSLALFPVPRSKADTCTRAHTLHTRPPQSPLGQ